MKAASILVARLRCLVGITGLVSVFAHAGPLDVGGQFSVNEMGAVTYTIPLQVPPGTAGIEPKLSLTYNNQGGNGLLGMGWSLSGLSALTRCPRTIAQDGVRSGVNFDTNDRFCLDGQRLMVVSGSYGVDGAEYRTERESFSKIISYGTAGNGPAWFKVWTKAGQVIEYGNTADSRIEAQGKASARVWAMNKLADTKGNYLTVSYTEDGTNGDYVPSRIDYTGNTNTALTPNNSVQFVYETRPDITPLYLAGSLIRSTQRLKTVQTYAGASLAKEIRLTYTTGTTTNRSRIATVTECALPSNVCKAPLALGLSEYGSNAFNAGSSWTTLAASFFADVNGDGRADFVGQLSDGIYVATSTGTGAGASSKWVSNFGYGQGYSDQNITPIFLIDVNADGLADVIGFASDGVYVALSSGSGFNAASKWISDFGTATGWTNMDTYPRTLADVNGDGRPDIVGFKNDGVYVALNTGTGFGAATKWISDFGTATPNAYATNSANPRLVADINGDGLADIIGFPSSGTFVALNTGTSFAPATFWLADFGIKDGWSTQDTYPRTLADLNGDGLPDVVGFKSDGVYVAINTGTGLQMASKWLTDFGTATATAYSSQKGFPRYVADVNGDGKADIVGFAANGVQVALGTGTGFNPSSQWVAGFGSAAGYGTGNPRQLADFDGDGFPDVAGTLSSGTSVARTARTSPPDWITSLANGMGATTTLTYGPLTTGTLYTRGSGASYPQADITAPFYVVQQVKTPNALGSNYITNYYKYGGLRVDLAGRGLLGFGWAQTTLAETGIVIRTDYRQDWPYAGLPLQVQKVLPGYGNNGILSWVNNNYACLNPQTGSSCTIAAGNRYFPYMSQSTEFSWDGNGMALPVVQTSNVFDGYGNATQITVATSDSFNKTTTNTYTNDTTNWLLGRLLRSQVTSVSGATPINPSSPFFAFNATITANTQNYNLRTAAITAGWDGVRPLVATVTVNSGVFVYSNSTALPAFDTGSNFPSSTMITINNNGYITGKGGAGGASYSNTTGSASPGLVGGLAMSLGYNISINNTGYIAGGGGGGGGGIHDTSDPYHYTSGGGGAGGGAGGPAYTTGYTGTPSPGGVGIAGTYGNGSRTFTQGASGGWQLPGTGGVSGRPAPGGHGAGGASGSDPLCTPGLGGAANAAGTNASSVCSGGGGGWGAVGGSSAAAGGAGGGAVKLNGNSVTWMGGSQLTTVFGAIN